MEIHVITGLMDFAPTPNIVSVLLQPTDGEVEVLAHSEHGQVVSKLCSDALTLYIELLIVNFILY